MANAKFTTPQGTSLEISGTPEEIQKFLKIYESSTISTTSTNPNSKNKELPVKRINSEGSKPKSENILLEIVNKIKDCDEAKEIEENILDRNSQVDKVLLPLYVIHEYLNDDVALQSGEISKITGDLGILIKQPNVSRILSETASRYVMGDKVRKAKQPVKYKLNRKGQKYIKGVITGKQDV